MNRLTEANWGYEIVACVPYKFGARLLELQDRVELPTPIKKVGPHRNAAHVIFIHHTPYSITFTFIVHLHH